MQVHSFTKLAYLCIYQLKVGMENQKQVHKVDHIKCMTAHEPCCSNIRDWIHVPAVPKV